MRTDSWRQVVRALEQERVTHLFGLPGSPGHLYDALYDSEQIRSILVRHETSGVFMAMAYARVTGDVGVCFGSPGPGVANLVPGILEAYSGCTPVLALGVRASTRIEGMGAFQETDQVGMMRPITKWAVTVERPERIGWTIRRAMTIATTGKPGPVYVELPADIALTESDHPEYVPADVTVRPGPDPVRIADLAEMVAGADRPVMVCGGGTILSGAYDQVRAIADDVGIPVLATPAGRGIIPESHEMFCGSVGLYRTELPKEIYQEADLLITVGSRMEEFQSGAFHYFPEHARFVQIDIDPFEFGRNWTPDLAIQSDASLALAELLKVCIEGDIRASDERLQSIADRRRNAIERMVDDVESVTGAIKAKRVVYEINQVYGDNTITVLENGKADLWSYYWPYHQILSTGSLVPPAEQTAMGLGVCGAIGAKLGRPDSQVVCTTGDGAFQMAMHELITAVEWQTPVTWVVLNDNALGWPQWTQRTSLSNRVIATDFKTELDVVKVAEAAGCWATRVDHVDGLRSALEGACEANKQGQPAVVDVIIDPDDHHAGFYEFHEVR